MTVPVTNDVWLSKGVAQLRRVCAKVFVDYNSCRANVGRISKKS
jgi:hypothetical protein